MTKDDLIHYKEWFSTFCRSFYTEDDNDRKNIVLKEEHTKAVCANMALIAPDTLQSEDGLLVADTVALFHDVGRFPQYARYKTFKDSVSINHGLLGSQILESERVLDTLSPRQKEVILTAVKYHNTFAIPKGFDKEINTALALVRDADKLDIWRVFIDFFSLPLHERPSAVGLGYPDLEEYSPELIDYLYTGRIIPLKLVRSLHDYKLLQLSWVYDLNVPASLRLTKERKYIEGTARNLPDNEEIRKMRDYLLEYVNQAEKK